MNQTTATARPANRLAHEKSPYLLQHAHNPVDWYPWGEEAFARARTENLPIFLSIGYSTCHWCHVMERESFENEETARYLNAHFVAIKVDREERPDVDKIYMTFVQATTGSGGWPLNVFLTPDRKPFFGGTYFPPHNRYGRPSFLQVLRQVAGLWQERHGEVTASANDIHARLEAAGASGTTTGSLPTADALRQAGALFKAAYDPQHGGFGGAPKFPQPSQPAFLLRYAARFKDVEAARMVLHTCERMAAGGIHDQLGGGFARYSVDAGWLVPHFEKMLYDQAQLTHLYLDAYVVAKSEVRSPKSEAYANVVRDILDYVLRDLTHPAGGFYSAEDADSEGHEGKFYCWRQAELSKLLTVEEFNVAARCFGITAEGNFVDHSHPTPLRGQNVLSLVNPVGAPVSDPARANEDQALLAAATKKMRAARSKRIRPQRDDKVLTSWNGLMLGALARAYAVLGDEAYRAAAEKNLAFLQAKLWQPLSEALSKPRSGELVFAANLRDPEEHLAANASSPLRRPGVERRSSESGVGNPKPEVTAGALFHRWRDGERDQVQLLEDYAFLLDGVLHLYEATLEPRHLDFAIALAEGMIADFYDSQHGGFWQSTAAATDLILRTKDDYDGAEPSGNSVATLALLKLAAITGREDFRRPAEATLKLFAARLEKLPQALPCLLHALDFSLEEPRRIVVAGDRKSTKFDALLRAAHSVYQPNKVVLGNTGPVEAFATTLPAKEGPVAYLCTGKACQPPTSEPSQVVLLLKQPFGARDTDSF